MTMNRPCTLAATLAVVMLVGASDAAGQIEAIATARHDLELSFTISGRVTKVLAELGDQVETGQPLVMLDESQIAAQVALLEIRAASDLEEQAAEAAWRLAIAEQQRVEDSFAKNAAAAFEVEKAKLDTKRAMLGFELAKQRRQEERRRLDEAQARRAQFTLRAPIAGMIEAIAVEQGESVQALQQVVRLVVTDPLVIEAPVPTEQTLGLHVGGRAWVRLGLPGYDEPIEGRITHLAQVADAASGTRIVRIEAPNTASAPAGVAVTVRFTQPDLRKGAVGDAGEKLEP